MVAGVSGTGAPVGPEDALGSTRRRIVDTLKRRARTAPELASDAGVTGEAVRQQLRALERAGLVTGRQRAAHGRGRPPTEWVLTDLASELFPDRHGDLTVDLIRSIRETVGDDALGRIIDDRSRRMAESYAATVTVADDALLALAGRRTAEGYVAEVREEPDGSRLLIEHHCPICAAAAACQGLCRGELELFRTVLGDGVEVTREQHLLSGDERCAYRVRARPDQPA